MSDTIKDLKAENEQFRRALKDLSTKYGDLYYASQDAFADADGQRAKNAELLVTLAAVEHEVALVYDALTRGRISKANTKAEVVIAVVQDFHSEELNALEARLAVVMGALETFWDELANECHEAFYFVVNTHRVGDDKDIEWWMPIGPFRRLYKATKEARHDNLP